MKTKRMSLIFLLFCLIFSVLYQSGSSNSLERFWQKTFGGRTYDIGYSVQQTSDGGYIIAGYTDSFGAGNADVYLIKTDIRGNLLWQMTFGGINNDMGSSVQETTDGGFIIAGDTCSFGAGQNDFYLIKTDPNGDRKWQKTFGGSDDDYCYSVRETTDGGFILAGTTYSFGAGYSDVYLVKTDPNGNLLWQKTFGGKDYDFGYSVQQTSDGGFIIAGSISSFGAGSSDVYLINTDPNGNSLWQKTFGGSGPDVGRSVQQTSDGGFIIVGSTKSYGAGLDDAYLIKTDPDGNLIWQRTFGGSDWEAGESIQQTSDGGFIIAGYTKSFGAGPSDLYLIKTDPNGNSQWQKTFGGNYNDAGCSVQQITDGGFIIAGYTHPSALGAEDVYLIKICSENTSLADLNCDGRVDFYDFAILANQWLQEPSIPSADIAPAVPDNFVDTLDLAAFVDYWLQGSPP